MFTKSIINSACWSVVWGGEEQQCCSCFDKSQYAIYLVSVCACWKIMMLMIYYNGTTYLHHQQCIILRYFTRTTLDSNPFTMQRGVERDKIVYHTNMNHNTLLLVVHREWIELFQDHFLFYIFFLLDNIVSSGDFSGLIRSWKNTGKSLRHKYTYIEITKT